MPIGIFDSGYGGLTVLTALQKALPRQDFIYFGDSANAPIGGRPESEIIDITMAGTKRLFDLGCELVILACNTASAIALRPMQEYFVPADRRVLGVLVPVIEVIAGRPYGTHGKPEEGEPFDVYFFATPATVASRTFARELALRITGPRVMAEPCPGLAGAIEAGDMGRADRIVRTAVQAATSRAAEGRFAVLGCTHYPLVEDTFAAALPKTTRILSQPAAVASALARYLDRFPRFAGGTGQTLCLTSGDPAAVSAGASRLLGRDVAFRSA